VWVRLESTHPRTLLGGLLSGNDAVEEDFGSSHVGGRCADIAWVVDEVAADGEADSVGFGLLRANGGDNSSVGDLAVRRIHVG
jgi:hypothetical protein